MNMRICCLLVGVVVSAALWGGMDNAERPNFKPDAEARALIEKCREQAKAYRPHVSRPRLFSRGQIKYGIECDYFIHRYYDRPLLQDPGLGKFSEKGHLLNLPAWRKTAEMVRLGGMDGLAVCLWQSGRMDVIDRSRRPGGEMQILVEMPYPKPMAGMKVSTVDDYVRVATNALAMPNAFRLDGKVVLGRYPGMSDDELELFAEVKRRLLELCGDKFALMPYVRLFTSQELAEKTLTAETIERARERLRAKLRVIDGAFVADRDQTWNRRVHREFGDDILYPILKSVLAEPEFRGKYFGYNVSVGHENCYRWRCWQDSHGTQTICDYTQQAIDLGCDFMMFAEWDEQKENTSLRPTVSHGFTHQRILRAFVNRADGKSEPMPGDDVTVPNLVLSYRRDITAGETAEFEVRAIPDGTFAGETFTVSLRLLAPDGAAVKDFPPQKVEADRFDSVWFCMPSHLLAPYRAVVPELTVRGSKGYEGVFGRGLWPMGVAALGQPDMKWAKTSLRDVAGGVKTAWEVTGPDADGLYTVSGRVTSEKELRSVEVIDDCDSIWFYEPGRTNEHLYVRVAVKTNRDRTRQPVVGDIRIAGLGREIAPQGGVGAVLSTAQPFDRKISRWGEPLFFPVTDDDIEKGVLEINYEPYLSAKIPLKELKEKEAIGGCGPEVTSFGATLYRAIPRQPEVCGGKDVRFSFRMKPMEKASLLRLQVIDSDYRTFRASPKTVWRPTGEIVSVPVLNRDSEAIETMKVDRGLLRTLKYDFTDTSRGTALWSPEGRRYWGQWKGGVAANLSAYGWGETMYTCQNNSDTDIDDYRNTSIGTLPVEMIPSLAGFRLTVMVKPAESGRGRKMGLVSSGNCGIDLSIADSGELLVETGGGNWTAKGNGYGMPKICGGQVSYGAWNEISVVCDRRTIRILQDGREVAEREYNDHFYNQRNLLIGAQHQQEQRTSSRFAGEFRTLEIAPLELPQ